MGKRFVAFGGWQLYTIVFAVVIVLVGLAVAIVSGNARGIGVGVAVAIGAGFILRRYIKGRKQYEHEAVAWIYQTESNVYCIEPEANRRWRAQPAELRQRFIRAMHEVGDRLHAHDLIQGVDFIIVDQPFVEPGMDGKQKGVYYPSRHQIKLWWPADAAEPPTLRHEIIHIPIALRDMLDGSGATHARMNELVAQGLIPAEWL